MRVRLFDAAGGGALGGQISVGGDGLASENVHVGHLLAHLAVDLRYAGKTLSGGSMRVLPCPALPVTRRDRAA